MIRRFSSLNITDVNADLTLRLDMSHEVMLKWTVRPSILIVRGISPASRCLPNACDGSRSCSNQMMQYRRWMFGLGSLATDCIGSSKHARELLTLGGGCWTKAFNNPLWLPFGSTLFSYSNPSSGCGLTQACLVVGN